MSLSDEPRLFSRLMVFTLLLTGSGVLAQYCDVDPNYPMGGWPESYVRCIAVEPAGSTLIGGSFTNIAGIDQRYLARLKANGEVDAGFAPQLSSYPGTLQSLPDGRILVSGGFTNVNGIIVPGLALLRSDGSVDGSFQPPTPSRGSQLSGTAAPDGSVWVTGGFTNLSAALIRGIARLLPDGSPDPAFQSPLAPGDSARVLAIQPDGKVIVGGTFVVPGVSTNRLLRLERNGTVDPTYVSALLPEERVSRAVLLEDGRLVASVYKSPVDYDYAVSSPRLVRLNTNGALEAGFNLQTESPGLSYNGGILGILLQPDGKIIVHGIFLKIGGVGRGKIARVLPDGSVDPCFDVPFAGEWTPFAAAAAPDGSILVGGSFRQLGGIPSMNLARLIPQPCANGIISMAVPALRWRVDAGPALVPIVRQGGLDLEQTVSFSTSDGSGQNGTITFGVGQRSQVISLALGIGTHEVTLTEASGGASLGTQTRTVVTVNPSAGAGTSGSPDTNYIVRLDGPVSSIDVLPDGRAYISGYFTNVNGDLCPGLARLQADGNRDNTFNRTQRIVESFNDIAIDHNGRVLVAGYFTHVDGVFTPGLARLNLDGSVDQGFAPLAPWGTNSYGVGAEAGSLAVLADGSIVCGAYLPGSNTASEKNVVLKLSQSGEPEPLFGNGLPTEPYFARLRPLGSGHIYGAGSGLGATVTRLTPDGSLDLSFVLPNELQGTYYSTQVETLPDGRAVILSAPSAFAGLISAQRIWRANPDGSFDAGFVLQSYGSDGLLDSIDTYAVESDGAVVAYGYFTASSKKLIARFHANGSPDLSFDPGTGPTASSSSPYVRAIKALPSGEWLVGGDFLGYDGFIQKHLVKLLPAQISRPPAFRFASTNMTLRETNVTLTLEVRRRGDASTAASVTVRTIDGTAVGGQDFVPLQTNLVFAAGEWIRTVEVALLNDSYVEGTESFTVALTNATGGFGLEQPSTLSIAIQNDDAALEFTKPVYEFMEEDGYAVIPVKWSGAVTKGMSASLRIVPISGNASDLEFTSLRFTYGGVTNWLRIPIRDDAQREETRLFRLELEAAENIYIAPQSIAFLAIEDGDFLTTPARGVSGIVNAVVSSSRGGLYVAGEFTGVHGQSRRNVARLLPNGEVDPEFNPGSGPDGVVFAAAAQPDDKLLIAGVFSNCNGVGRAGVARLNADGTVDTTFDPGVGPTSTNATPMITSVAVAQNGEILVGGLFTHFNGRYSYALARLRTNGAVNTEFTSPLRQSLSYPSPRPPVNLTVLRSVQCLPDGKILIAGSLGLQSFAGLARLFPNGQLDRTLYANSTYCAAPLGDNTFLVGLSSSTPTPGVARVRTNGTSDLTFRVRNVPNLLPSSVVQQIAVQPDGRILCTAFHYPSSNPLQFVDRIDHALVFRFLPDGAWDSSFAPLFCEFPLLTNPGVFWYTQPRSLYETPPAAGAKFAQQTDGVLVLGGAFDFVNGEARHRLARFDPNGALRGRLLLGLEGGAFLRLSLPGEVERPYTIETSMDLAHWTPWLMNQYPWYGAELVFPANEPVRYFRAVPSQ